MPDSSESSAARKEGIVKATSGKFLRYGFKKTSMDDLARAAGLSRQGLYLHFATKEALFKQMVLSTEIRLASLALLGITRAACSHTRSLSKVAYGFDTVMWTLENIYPMVLIVDLLMAKMMSGFFVRVDKATRTVVDGGKCNCGRREEGQRVIKPPNPDDIEDSLGSELSPEESKGSKANIGHYVEESPSLTEIRSTESRPASITCQ